MSCYCRFTERSCVIVLDAQLPAGSKIMLCMRYIDMRYVINNQPSVQSADSILSRALWKCFTEAMDASDTCP